MLSWLDVRAPSRGQAFALFTDAGPFSIMQSPVWAIHVVNARTAALEDSVMLPRRPRSITLHPTLPVAYIIYELSAQVDGRGCHSPEARGEGIMRI